MHNSLQLQILTAKCLMWSFHWQLRLWSLQVSVLSRYHSKVALISMFFFPASGSNFSWLLVVPFIISKSQSGYPLYLIIVKVPSGCFGQGLLILCQILFLVLDQGQLFCTLEAFGNIWNLAGVGWDKECFQQLVSGGQGYCLIFYNAQGSPPTHTPGIIWSQLLLVSRLRNCSILKRCILTLNPIFLYLAISLQSPNLHTHINHFTIVITCQD